MPGAQTDRPDTAQRIEFLTSLPEALSEANVRECRIFVYVAGKNCYWCRVLEGQTLPDASVVAASRQYVCVKLFLGADPDLAVKYQVRSTPQSLILSSDAALVARLAGYHSGEKYAAWLRDPPAATGIIDDEPASESPAPGDESQPQG